MPWQKRARDAEALEKPPNVGALVQQDAIGCLKGSLKGTFLGSKHDSVSVLLLGIGLCGLFCGYNIWYIYMGGLLILRASAFRT